MQLQDLDLIVSEHLLEMAGARVRVRDGEVEVLTEPAIRSCPLRRDLYGIDKESKETVKKVLEEHMAELGMYGPRRVLELENKPVSFGASEILSDALAEGSSMPQCWSARERGRWWWRSQRFCRPSGLI